MKKVFPPILTVIGFIDSLNLDANIFCESGSNILTANCVSKSNSDYVCQIQFKHFDIKCDKIKNIRELWLNYVFENDKKYFRDLADFYIKKAAKNVRGDYRFIEHLKQAGFINADSVDETKTDNQ